MVDRSILALQEASAAFRWTYIWLAAGGLFLVLVVLAFTYLLAKRHWNRFGSVARHSLLQSADRKLADHFPRVWRFIRGRFSIRQWRGLALTAMTFVLFSTMYLFAMITESWTDEQALYAFDQRIYAWLIDAMHPAVLAVMRIVTHSADLITISVLSVALGVLLYVRGHPWRLLELFLTAGVGAAVMWGLKLLFERARPSEAITQAAGHSFPSGHSFMAAAFYAFLIYLTWRMVRNDAIRISVTIVLVLVIFLTGLSRVVLRVHWVSDVIGGFTGGIAWLVCSLLIAQSIRHYRGYRKSVAAGRDAPT